MTYPLPQPRSPCVELHDESTGLLTLRPDNVGDREWAVDTFETWQDDTGDVPVRLEVGNLED
ncbi:MAG: hypothetical protein JO108_18445 [Acidobacteriaceae bacterium]|nr:hypothetical protein [Acidobacteriaceae bacterium]